MNPDDLVEIDMRLEFRTEDDWVTCHLAMKGKERILLAKVVRAPMEGNKELFDKYKEFMGSIFKATMEGVIGEKVPSLQFIERKPVQQ